MMLQASLRMEHYAIHARTFCGAGDREPNLCADHCCVELVSRAIHIQRFVLLVYVADGLLSVPIDGLIGTPGCMRQKIVDTWWTR